MRFSVVAEMFVNHEDYEASTGLKGDVVFFLSLALWYEVCRVRDGNVYITQKPPRIHSTPLFREDNSTLTLGRDNRYYFVFTMPKDQLDILPDRLVHQALAIAQKVDAMVTGRIGKKGSKK